MNQKGFTLLEVSLFLAISGALILVAFIGLAPRLNNVRFTSSVRTLESSLQRHMLDLQTGVTTHGENAGSTAETVLNGRMIEFQSDKIVYYPIISNRVALATEVCKQETAIRTAENIKTCYSPKVILEGKSEQQYGYGMTGIASGDKFIIIRNPANNETATFISNSSGGDDAISISTTQTINICLTMSPRTAKIMLNVGSLKPKVEFEACS